MPHIGARLLGALRIEFDDEDVTPTAGRLRQVLALLLVAGYDGVSTEHLMNQIWPTGSPDRAKAAVQTYICDVRRYFSTLGFGRDELIRTHPRGYALDLRRWRLDTHRFLELSRQARDELRYHSYDAALCSGVQAQQLWRGDFLCNVELGAFLSDQELHWQELRLQNLQTVASAAHHTDRSAEFITDLRQACHAHPFNEVLHADLYRLLWLSGRRIEALDELRDLGARLRSELGVEPSSELRNLEVAMLHDAPSFPIPAPKASLWAPRTA